LRSKMFKKFLLFLTLANPFLTVQGGIIDKIRHERRKVLYSSRQLAGECVSVCNTEERTTRTFLLDNQEAPESIAPTSPPTSAPTTSKPTRSPTLEPTTAPTRLPTVTPSSRPSPAPTLNPTAHPTSSPTSVYSCPQVTLNFNELAAGSYIHDQLWDTKCVKITARKWRESDTYGFTPDAFGNHMNSGGAARVFDTSNPECDDDLGSPHEDFGGPGKGCGGGKYLMTKTKSGCVLKDGIKQDNPWKNDKPIGNVIIIQETDKDCPDDSLDGGVIKFEFCHATAVNIAKLLDVDESNNTPVIVVTHGNGTTKTYHTDATGDNGLWSKELNETDVVTVEVKFWGSGSIAELQYHSCPPGR